jgi:hypothetical protein
MSCDRRGNLHQKHPIDHLQPKTLVMQRLGLMMEWLNQVKLRRCDADDVLNFAPTAHVRGGSSSMRQSILFVPIAIGITMPLGIASTNSTMDDIRQHA